MCCTLSTSLSHCVDNHPISVSCPSTHGWEQPLSLRDQWWLSSTNLPNATYSLEGEKQSPKVLKGFNTSQTGRKGKLQSLSIFNVLQEVGITVQTYIFLCISTWGQTIISSSRYISFWALQSGTNSPWLLLAMLKCCFSSGNSTVCSKCWETKQHFRIFKRDVKCFKSHHCLLIVGAVIQIHHSSLKYCVKGMYVIPTEYTNSSPKGTE